MEAGSSPEPQARKKVYLPGLHGLRFLAAFSVFFGHLEQAKGWMGYTPLLGFDLSPTLASDGVTFFFVLSGFLITFLLMTEQQKTGNISIPNFYKRRLLRIWPLYYLFMFLTFAVIPYIRFLRFPQLDMVISHDYWRQLGLFLLMSPHVSLLVYGAIGVGAPLWSVGVEEYFYMVWPHLVKRLYAWLPVVLVGVIVVPLLFRMYGNGFLKIFFAWARFDCMGWGGLGAWASLRCRERIGWLFSLPVQVVAYGMAVMHLLVWVKYGKFYIGFWVYSLVYLVILMNVALNPRSLLKLENRFFRFMGEISYGFYVFHWLVLVVCINSLEALGGIQHEFFRSVVLLLSTFGLTTLLASFSFFYWERRFLLRKPGCTALTPQPALS